MHISVQHYLIDIMDNLLWDDLSWKFGGIGWLERAGILCNSMHSPLMVESCLNFREVFLNELLAWYNGSDGYFPCFAVDVQSYKVHVKADEAVETAEHLTCPPARRLALAQRYFLFWMGCWNQQLWLLPTQVFVPNGSLHIGSASCVIHVYADNSILITL